MDETSISRYITETFEGVEVTQASGNSFFFYDPEQKFPFVTLVTNDEYDQASNLNRPSVFRLNIGVGKHTFQSLFDSAAGDDNYDFTTLDKIMPHPVYGKMHWICVLNPSEATFETVKSLLAEAYEMAVSRQARKESAGGS